MTPTNPQHTGDPTMRRVVYVRYGGPEVLEVQDAPRPRPGKKQVLIRMLASSVNGGDLAGRAGKAKFQSTLFTPGFPKPLGMDVFGRVEEIGDVVRADDDGLRPGDLVWGVSTSLDALAEYAVMDAVRVARAPEGLEPAEVGVLPVAGTTARAAVDDFAHLRPGESVLVRGGAGGVGSMIVQVAHARGGRVVALASEDTREQVLALGADEVLDHHTTPTESLPLFDVVIDTVGSGLEPFRRHLAPAGRFVTITADLAHPVRSGLAVATSVRHGRGRIRQMISIPKAADMKALTDEVEAGTLRPVIDRVFPLDQIRAAHERVEQHGTVGKVGIEIG
jgi:NADPH:quinone reductase-like Zn-dependent oxidoreductase